MTSRLLTARLQRRLPPQAATLLRATRREAAARGLPLYLVGGALRDLLRLRTRLLTDLDLALDGRTDALARAVAAATGAHLTRHDRFGTATLQLGDARLDLARTRRERYPRPAALPHVAPAPIAADLGRRDFTVNALALTLTGPASGAILDPCQGRADLAARRLRTLHDASFRDDPTRLIRACRYAARLHARLAPATARAARRDRGGLAALSAARFAAAWRLLLEDEAAAAALLHARRLGLTQARCPGWTLPPRLLRAFAARRDAPPAPFFWALVGLTADPHLLQRLPQRVVLQRDERRALEAGRRLRAQRRALARPGLRPSRAAARLRPLPPSALQAAALLWHGRAAARIDTYLGRWQAAHSPLNAAALQRLGLRPGPALGAWLDRLRDATIDGALPPGPRGRAAAAAHWLQSARAPRAP